MQLNEIPPSWERLPALHVTPARKEAVRTSPQQADLLMPQGRQWGCSRASIKTCLIREISHSARLTVENLVLNIANATDKGKPAERRGRKVTGLTGFTLGQRDRQDSREVCATTPTTLRVRC